MMLDTILLRLRRADSPLFRRLRKIISFLLQNTLPAPRVLKPLLRLGYQFHFFVWYTGRYLLNFFYRGPLFKSRCETVGRNLTLYLMPDVSGPVKIHIGDDVELFGHLGVMSGSVYNEPRLVIGNRVDIGHNVVITVNQEVVIEDEVNIASGVRIVDTDAHPRSTEARAANLPPPKDEIKPVRIGRRAWIGQGAYILKGVTIGEGSVVGVNSVVVSDVPPFCVAMGNPARVVVKNLNQTAGSE